MPTLLIAQLRSIKFVDEIEGFEGQTTNVNVGH